MEPRSFRLLRNLGRTREIVVVLLNHGFGDVVDRLGLRSAWSRWKRWLLRQKPQPVHHLRAVERVRLTLESLGPTFIKFGQVISTRPDLIPKEMLTELQRLQERCPPFPSSVAMQVLESELGQPVERLFASIEREPMAAGSLGQVHRAIDFDGTVLAVKIRRPQVVRDVERDLSLMADLAQLLERHIPEARVFDPTGLVTHFGRTIRRELNFAREGRTMDEFRRMFADEPQFCVASVRWDRTTEAVLTMEFVEGFHVDELTGGAQAQITPADVAALGARLYMRQAFELGIFHGDPHPGNIRIRPDGRLCLLDYGMVGMIEPRLREELVDFFVAVSRQDVDAARRLVLAIGEPRGPVDLSLLNVDLRDFLTNYYGVDLEQLQVDRMLADFVSILSTNSIRCPPSLMLLIRALVTLDGIGRRLDPTFNLALHLQPFVETLVRQRYEPKRMVDRVWAETLNMGSVLQSLPGRVLDVATRLESGELSMRLDHRNLDHFTIEMERASNRLVVGLVLAALILASALVVRSGGNVYLSVPVYVASSILALWLVYGIFRSGRL